MPKSSMRIILDVEFTAVGKLLYDLRGRPGVLAIDPFGQTESKPQSSSSHETPKLPFRKAVIAALYANGPMTIERVRVALATYEQKQYRASHCLSRLMHA